MDRHERQIRLTEVGSAGQARLARACVDVPLDGVAGEIAARYLAGAGVRRIRVTSAILAEGARAIDPDVSVEVSPRAEQQPLAAFDFVEEPACELARGALAALRAIRAALRDPEDA